MCGQPCVDAADNMDFEHRLVETEGLKLNETQFEIGSGEATLKGERNQRGPSWKRGNKDIDPSPKSAGLELVRIPEDDGTDKHDNDPEDFQRYGFL